MTRKMKAIALYLLVSLLVIASTFVCSARAQALLQVGSQAPDFSLEDLGGKKVALASFSQKRALVLVFWSTWSSNSTKALRRFEEFHRKYAERGIQVVGISAENQAMSAQDIYNVRKAIKELDITFPVLLDSGLNTFHDYGIVALPSTVIISDGKIEYELPGFPLVGTEEMFDYLRVLSGEKPRTETEPAYRPRHDAVADTNLAKGFVRKKMSGLAYPLLKKAIEKDPKYMLPYVELARLYASDGDAASAEITLRKALSAGPGNVVVMSELGYLLSKTGKIREAVDILETAAKTDSFTPSLYYLAYALGKDGRLKESMEAFEKAVSLNPFDSLLYRLRAETYETGKMPKEAAADYRKALKILLKVKG